MLQSVAYPCELTRTPHLSSEYEKSHVPPQEPASGFTDCPIEAVLKPVVTVLLLEVLGTQDDEGGELQGVGSCCGGGG